MRKRTIRHKGFPISVHAIWCDDLRAAAESVRRQVPKLDERAGVAGAAAAVLHSDERPFECWVLLSKKPLLGEIAHEAVHAANFLLRDLGVETTMKNDEPHAYLVQWICEELTKK